MWKEHSNLMFCSTSPYFAIASAVSCRGLSGFAIMRPGPVSPSEIHGFNIAEFKFRWIQSICCDGASWPFLCRRMSSLRWFRCTCLDECPCLHVLCAVNCLCSILLRLQGSWTIVSVLEASLVSWFALHSTFTGWMVDHCIGRKARVIFSSRFFSPRSLTFTSLDDLGAQWGVIVCM